MSLRAAAMGGIVKQPLSPQWHPYNCHSAVLHWGLISLGNTHAEAQTTVEKITRHFCEHCRGRTNAKKSLNSFAYGFTFCQDAVQLNQNIYAPGDVVIFPTQALPTHSMVIVDMDMADIWIRGYNNAGSFIGAPYDAYDPTSRKLADRNRINETPLFRISEAAFMNRLRAMVRMLTMPSRKFVGLPRRN